MDDIKDTERARIKRLAGYIKSANERNFTQCGQTRLDEIVVTLLAMIDEEISNGIKDLKEEIVVSLPVEFNDIEPLKNSDVQRYVIATLIAILKHQKYMIKLTEMDDENCTLVIYCVSDYTRLFEEIHSNIISDAFTD